MVLTITFDREADGRWIASVEELPGVHVYGDSEADSLAKVQALALSVLSDEVAHGEHATAGLR